MEACASSSGAHPHSLLPGSIRPLPRLLSALPRSFSLSVRSHIRRHRKQCLPAFASSSSSSSLSADTLVASVTRKDKADSEEVADLTSWMHINGLSPCKVVLNERPSLDSKLSPIHYVAASEDLQPGDVAFSVPNSLVVTLERVLGNETIGMLLYTF